MLTMRDIAKHVGVSVSAVSLVLNDRADGRIRADVAAEIRRAAHEMGYVPNQLARSLKSRQTQTIGLVTDEAASVPFSGHLIGGAQRTASERGYLLMLIDTAGDEALQVPAVKSLLQRNIEALIFATAYHKYVDVPTVPESVPVVVLDGRPSDSSAPTDYVVPDETAGAYAGTARLVEAGHRKIAFCTTATAYPIAAGLRETGYRQALEDAGIPVDPSLTTSVKTLSTAGALEPALALLSRSDRPSAVFCFSDQIAMGFYQAAGRLGLRIPEDLSIVGFDNQEYVAEALDPGLTTVQMPHAEMGEWAARRAFERIGGELDGLPPEGYLMPCPLVERMSVAPPRS
ncbi:MAG: LacI family DNA-binding transcriptional regulator [Humibacter sp.]